MTMKEIIRKSLSLLGYKIERVDNQNPLEPKYHRLIKEVYGLYKELKLTSLKSDIDSKSIALMANLDGTQISEAVYLLNALEQTLSLKGDVCEFGVAQGLTSALFAHSIRSSDKNLWLFDSFEGLPAPTEKDKLKDDIFDLKNIEAYQGTMSHAKEKVIKNLQNVEFPASRTKIVDGFIEKTIQSTELPKVVAFAYVDFDFYNPIKIALDFLHTVLVKGGIIIIDDYDFFSEGAKIAVDEFLSEKRSEYVMELPISSAGKFAILIRNT